MYAFGQHSGVARKAAASQCQGPEFYLDLGYCLCGVFMFSRHHVSFLVTLCLSFQAEAGHSAGETIPADPGHPLPVMVVAECADVHHAALHGIAG